MQLRDDVGVVQRSHPLDLKIVVSGEATPLCGRALLLWPGEHDAGTMPCQDLGYRVGERKRSALAHGPAVDGFAHVAAFHAASKSGWRLVMQLVSLVQPECVWPLAWRHAWWCKKLLPRQDAVARGLRGGGGRAQ